MERRSNPDLNRLMAEWRRRMEERGAIDAAALDEYESHIREEVDRLLERGLPERQAFFEAAARLGHQDLIAGEYRKLRDVPDPKRAPLESLAWTGALVKSYLVASLRNLRRRKVYAFINIAGLALGLATCLVIGLFVRHKLSYDRYHPNAERVYRVHSSLGGTNHATVSPGLAQALEDRFPEIEQATLVFRPGRQLIEFDNDAN